MAKTCAREGCGKSLEGKRRGTRHCSPACKDKVYYAANRERRAEHDAQWYAANRDRRVKQCAQWRAANPEYDAQYRAANRDRIAEYGAQWRAANPDKNRAKDARRRAHKAMSTLDWFTPGWDAPLFTEATERGLHVDHKTPIAPCRDCGQAGLHIPGNLQLLTPAENISKGNRCQQCWYHVQYKRAIAKLAEMYRAEGVADHWPGHLAALKEQHGLV